MNYDLIRRSLIQNIALKVADVPKNFNSKTIYFSTLRNILQLQYTFAKLKKLPSVFKGFLKKTGTFTLGKQRKLSFFALRIILENTTILIFLIL